MTGNVVMTQDSMIVRGPVCFYDRDTRIARFPYGLVIERPSGTTVADAGSWDRGARKVELRGRVAAADTSGTLDADAATYDEASETLFASGHARLVDEGSDMLVEADGLRYEQRKPLGTATGQPVATFDDQGTPVRVASDEMRYDPKKNVGVATGRGADAQDHATGGR
jgi:lipopolysaccharide assembly outer membrane protein LptD (OstA)